jgi:reverse gyrase
MKKTSAQKCPTCDGAMSDYMAKKEGVCWSCIKWDSKGGAYRLRYNKKNKQQLGFDVSSLNK